ncbi:hypothetical protein [Methylovulum miyakonense]|uniref:hypothetical protein n=1 Tax=Methylovulum miyakonense TaxID=645578 RepID=UPI0012EC98FD|nr:hypothetical protein [Methylovulum miyakonense]
MEPDLMLESVAWSFKEPIPDSPSALTNAISVYYDEINIPKPFDKNLLTSTSPLERLDVTYIYALPKINKKNNLIEWEKVPMIVKIDGGGKFLTYADILWQLHKAVYTYLKNDDHHFFEGLEFSGKNEEGVAEYEMWLGN